jgi:hypothetical protein
MMQLLLEHSGIPETMYADCLLYDGGYGILNEMDLHESTENGIKAMKFKGKFQEAETVNKNKRMYPFTVLDSNVTRLQEAINQGGLLGECDHPTDSIIHFSNCSHKITKLWWDSNILMGEGVILNTPMGKLLKALINDGVRIGISSRGVGNGKVNEEGILVIGESYKLITFDAVADPSTYAAFQEKVVGTAREAVVLPQISKNVVKNETESIDKISESLVLACISGLIEEEIYKIKARLNS